MFNKEANHYVKKVELTKNEFYKQYNNISITPAFVNMINKYYEDKNMQDHLEYDEKIKFYVDKMFKYGIKNHYDEKITNLYHSGKIKINKEDYNLKDFYIVFSDNNYHIMCADKRYHNEKTTYNKAFKFIDTSAFIKLIESYNVRENTIIIDSIDELLNIVKNWDGKLHNKTIETDAITNKKVGND